VHKYENLDGLRGLAAFVVVMWHYSLGFFPALAGIAIGASASKQLKFENLFATTPLHILFAGPSAVTLFFVLSGFVLSIKFFQHKDATILTSSALRRYLRLMIPALGSIIVTYLILRFGLNYETVTRTITHSSWLSTLWNFPANFGDALRQGMYSVFFTVNNPNSLTSYNFNLWTMHYELIGSFIVFAIMAFFGKLKNRWVVYTILAVGLIHTYYLSFLMGLIIADVWNNYEWIKDKINEVLCWSLLPLGLFLFAYYVPSSNTGIYAHMVIPTFGKVSSLIFFQTVGAVIVMVSVLRLRLLSRFFELRPLQFLGVNSFALYVIHLAILGSLACFIFNHLVFRVGHLEAFLVSFMISVSFTLFIARFYTQYVDGPAIALSKAFGDTIMKRDLSFSGIPKTSALKGNEDAVATVVEVSTIE
jgi:peptidoglycan/LPS O-acetylase OafA/YrhL